MKTLKSPSSLLLPRGIAECHVQVLRECPFPPTIPGRTGPAEPYPIADDPAKSANVFRTFADNDPAFDWERETMMVALVTTRRRVAGLQKLSVGTKDTLLIDPCLVFRLAVVANAFGVIIAHTHPSGDPMPSESDIRVTRELIRAGQLLKIDVLDHIVLGNPAFSAAYPRGFASLRELGYFYF